MWVNEALGTICVELNGMLIGVSRRLADLVVGHDARWYTRRGPRGNQVLRHIHHRSLIGRWIDELHGVYGGRG